MNIRPYEPRDRAAVREICCDTADSGKPVESFFPDREVFADLLTRYYTDTEPQSAFVAETDGQVIGYIIGAHDTRRFQRTMTWRIAPAAVLKALARGLLWHPQVRALLWANRDAVFRFAALTLGVSSNSACSGHADAVPLTDYPAHLHINLRAGHRSQRIGDQLLSRWLDQARQRAVRGIHASVNADNTGGCCFFEAMGFRALSRQPRMRFPGRDRLLETITYVLDLRSASETPELY